MIGSGDNGGWYLLEPRRQERGMGFVLYIGVWDMKSSNAREQ